MNPQSYEATITKILTAEAGLPQDKAAKIAGLISAALMEGEEPSPEDVRAARAVNQPMREYCARMGVDVRAFSRVWVKNNPGVAFAK